MTYAYKLPARHRRFGPETLAILEGFVADLRVGDDAKYRDAVMLLRDVTTWEARALEYAEQAESDRVTGIKRG